MFPGSLGAGRYLAQSRANAVDEKTTRCRAAEVPYAISNEKEGIAS